MDELYETLGDAKCKELYRKDATLWNVLHLSPNRKNTPVLGAVREGIARDFIKEFLPTGFAVKSGLVFNNEKRKMSPQIDGIIYSGVPLLEFTDVAIVEKNQVKAIVEVKSLIATTDIFGEKDKGSGKREPKTGLFKAFEERRKFLDEPTAKYILFAFELEAKKQNIEIIDRLKQISNMYAIVSRKEMGKPWESMDSYDFDFDNSVSELIKWLRNLS